VARQVTITVDMDDTGAVVEVRATGLEDVDPECTHLLDVRPMGDNFYRLAPWQGVRATLLVIGQAEPV
jgi:hypothetical protein